MILQAAPFSLGSVLSPIDSDSRSVRLGRSDLVGQEPYEKRDDGKNKVEQKAIEISLIGECRTSFIHFVHRLVLWSSSSILHDPVSS